jgi:hypothetical protein
MRLVRHRSATCHIQKAATPGGSLCAQNFKSYYCLWPRGALWTCPCRVQLRRALLRSSGRRRWTPMPLRPPRRSMQRGKTHPSTPPSMGLRPWQPTPCEQHRCVDEASAASQHLELRGPTNCSTLLASSGCRRRTSSNWSFCLRAMT